MKKFLSLFAATSLLFAACQKDNDQLAGSSNEGGVLVTLGVDAPEMGDTRSGESGMNSALGAIDNFDNAQLWGLFDVRYMLEIYDVTPGFENLTTPIKQRMVNIHDSYQSTMFELRLIPGRTYKFVVWADFVADGSHAAADKLAVTGLHYNTTDLHNITLNKWTPMDECRDAYFIQEDIEVETSLNRTLTLTRPFGKVRVITTDIDELNIGSVPSKVVITYENHPIFNSLNAITGLIDTELSGADLTHTYTISKSTPYSEGLDKEATHQTLFMDYLYAKDEQTEINFTIDVYEESGRLIRSNTFDTQIPIQRNYLTTIIGNLLTTATNIEIRIDDNFVDEYVVKVWGGEKEPLPAEDANGIITITTPGQLATLLSMDPDGMDIVLGNDIDFGGLEIPAYRDTAKGNNAAFTFDGKGHTISNFTVSNGVSAGLFSDLVSATVRDLNIQAAVVAPGASTRATSDFYAGALAGRTYGVCLFENIKVIDCEIEGVNKVGGLIGNVAEDNITVRGCVVDKSQVSTNSTEDGGCVGGLIGYVTGNATLEKNSVTNTVINAINSANEAKRANAELVGAFHGNGKSMNLAHNYCSGNTFNQAETTYVAPEGFYPWLGGIRYEGGSDVFVDGVSLLTQPLATPVIVSTTVDGNKVTLAWEDVENAAKYSVKANDETFEVELTTYTFTGEYATEYKFEVVAIPADSAKYTASEAATTTVTTEAKAATKATIAEFLAAAEDDTVYQLTGVITKVVNTSFGNFYLKDATGETYIYGLCSPEGAQKYWAESGAKVGDTITIETVRTSHNNSPQGKNAIFVALVPFVEEASEWGVVGDLTGWADGADIAMYNTWKADNLFVAYNVELASGSFKIRANNEWNDAKNYGLVTAGKVYADNYYGVYSSGGSQNISPMEDGTYDIYFDLTNERVALVTPGKEYADAKDGGEPVVVIDGLKEHTWGLVGSFEGSNWATDIAMNIDGDWAVAKNVTMAAGDQFKFRADGGWSLDYSAGCSVEVGTIYNTYTGQGNMTIAVAGTYNFYFSMVDAKFYMEPYTASTTVETVMENLGFANSAVVSSVSLDENVTLAFAKGSANNAPAYYTSGKAIRLYQNGAIMTVDANGRTITSIEITFGNNMYYLTPDCGEFTKEAAVRTWTGSAKSVKFTCTGTTSSTRAYITAIKVTYE